MNYKLGHRLKSSKKIEELFATGKQAKAFPLLMRYTETQQVDSKTAYAVSKRKFKSAVDRNRVKRLMREAYRLEKTNLIDSSARYLILFIYVGKNLPTLNELRLQMVELLKQLE